MIVFCEKKRRKQEENTKGNACEDVKGDRQIP